MIMVSSLKLVFIIGLALGFCHSIAENTNLQYLPSSHNTNNTDQPTSSLQRSPGFDYFLFVLQWPAAFCNIERNKKVPRDCNPYPLLPQHKDKFTVHGIWPELDGAGSPLFCSSQQSMTNDDLIAVKKDLVDYWPDLFNATNLPKPPNFWTREWNKHGKCSSNTFSPRQYLKITLDLAKLYAKPIFDELKKEGINPDGSTPHYTRYIRAAVKKITNREPMLNIQLNGLGDNLLLEIKLCVHKDGKTLFDCDPDLLFAAP